MQTERAISRNITTREIMKRGVETTEYEAQKSGTIWIIVAFVLGLVGTYGNQLIAAFGCNDSTGGVIASVVISVVGMIGTYLIKAGYIKSRTEVKTGALSAQLADAEAEAADAKLSLASVQAANNAARLDADKPASSPLVDGEVDPIAGLTRM